eukprot:Colp12_sorted_trinity150504_noHs@26456
MGLLFSCSLPENDELYDVRSVDTSFSSEDSRDERIALHDRLVDEKIRQRKEKREWIRKQVEARSSLLRVDSGSNILSMSSSESTMFGFAPVSSLSAPRQKMSVDDSLLVYHPRETSGKPSADEGGKTLQATPMRKHATRPRVAKRTSLRSH